MIVGTIDTYDIVTELAKVRREESVPEIVSMKVIVFITCQNLV